MITLVFFDTMSDFAKIIALSQAIKSTNPITLVPIRAMTGLGANGDMCPKKVVQKVSILDSSYLRQYRCSYCSGAQPHIP
jgi:hypothetical protein